MSQEPEIPCTALGEAASSHGRERALLDCRVSAVVAVEFPTDREMHQRYAIDSVPLVVIAGADGVVQRHFLGPVTATDLWAAVATERAD